MHKPRIAKPGRRQAVMKIEAPEDLIPQGHPARLIARVVDSVDLSKFTAHVKSVEHGGGRPVLCPAMLLTLWLYATSRGIGSAREIERLTKSDDAFKWIVGDLEVGRFAITEFRVGHGEALLALMADVLGVLRHKGLLSLDVVALDGTRVRACASAPSFRRFGSVAACREQALLHIKAVLADADNPELTARQHAAREAAARDILRRTDEALVTVARLQEERTPRAKTAKPALPAKRTQGSTTARTKATKRTPLAREARASTTDVDARVMKMPDGGFRPAYNIQLAVAGEETGGPRTIVGVDVVNVGSDMGAISKMIGEVRKMTGALPRVLLADGNHVRHACIDEATGRGVVVITPPSETSRVRAKDTPAVTAWRDRMTTDEASRVYRGRAALVELANSHLKTRYGLENVLVRGLGKVMCVALLGALTFHIMQHAAALAA